MTWSKDKKYWVGIHADHGLIAVHKNDLEDPHSLKIFIVEADSYGHYDRDIIRSKCETKVSDGDVAYAVARLEARKAKSILRKKASIPPTHRVVDRAEPGVGNKFNPTHEQKEILEAFVTGSSLKIIAYAGAGKTSTLRLLSKSSSRKGRYIAYNKSIASEAQREFPKNVDCKTSHSLAFRGIQGSIGYSSEKLTGKANAHLVVKTLELPETVHFDGLIKAGVGARSLAGIILGTISNFTTSDDDELHPDHVPIKGAVSFLSREMQNAFQKIALPYAIDLWNKMRSSDHAIPLGHDGYLKLWALEHPKIDSDFILLDEAQDSNSVLLGVLSRQDSQIIYVGDPYQQIYEWRGAINAMDKVNTKNTLYLTQSFRFGQQIADGAFKVISSIGATKRILGNPSKTSKIGAATPNAILCRTNARVIENLLDQLSKGRACHIVGGVGPLEAMLLSAHGLQQGHSSLLPEFFGFKNWDEVVQHSETEGAQDLKVLVNLVKIHGTVKLLEAVRRCASDENNAAISISTAHKSKGRQWACVTIDDDFDQSFINTNRTVQMAKTKTALRYAQNALEAETRLFYVALTRAMDVITVPSLCLKQFDIK